MASESLLPYNKSSPMPKIYVNTEFQKCKSVRFFVNEYFDSKRKVERERKKEERKKERVRENK
jgi:hypothetical protein